MSVPKWTPTSFTVPPAVMEYGSLVFQDRPVHDGDLFSRKHPRMTQLNRAKIFAPFAALAGFEERIGNKEIRYVSRHTLDADEEWELNHTLFDLHLLTANSRLARENMASVSVEYFEACSDEENESYRTKGLYRTVEGIVLRLDQQEQRLIILCAGDKKAIPFADIWKIRRKG